MLEGLHPTHARLQTGLPSARCAARVYFPGGDVLPLALAADTLFVDGDAERCALVWRGSFQVAGEEALAALAVVAGVELPHRPIAWPAHVAPAAPALPGPDDGDLADATPLSTMDLEPVSDEPSASQAAPARGRGGTLVILPDLPAATPAPAPRPPPPTFERTQAIPLDVAEQVRAGLPFTDAPIPARPVASPAPAERPPPRPAQSPFDGTMDLTAFAASASNTPAWLAREDPSTQRLPAVAPAPPGRGHEQTLQLTMEQTAAMMIAPFPIAAAREARPPAAPLEGTPWNAAPIKPVHAPTRIAEATIDLTPRPPEPEPIAAAPPDPPPPPPPAPIVAERPDPPPAPPTPIAQAAPEPIVAPPPPPPPPPPPRPRLPPEPDKNDGLYRRFTSKKK